MAPNQSIAWQTEAIIKCLFNEDGDGLDCCSRSLDASIETDGPEDDFDPVVIADKLRCVADALNDSVTFQATLSNLKKAAAQEAAEAAFSQGVETLCKNVAAQAPEVTSEMQLIRASTALGLYIVKSAPELKEKVHRAMASFLNRSVQTWVSEQGGWDRVNIQ